jgi:hypothetical protein
MKNIDPNMNRINVVDFDGASNAQRAADLIKSIPLPSQ